MRRAQRIEGVLVALPRVLEGEAVRAGGGTLLFYIWPTVNLVWPSRIFSTVRLLQMYLRYCRYYELVMAAYKSYGEKWCRAYQVENIGNGDTGFEMMCPQPELSDEQRQAYDAWVADRAAAKPTFAKPNNCPIPSHKSVEGWWPREDRFTHTVNWIAACRKLYTWPPISAIWPTMDTASAALVLMPALLQVAGPRLGGLVRRSDVPTRGEDEGQGERGDSVELKQQKRTWRGGAGVDAAVYLWSDVDTASEGPVSALDQLEQHGDSDLRAPHTRLRPSCVLPSRLACCRRVHVAPVRLDHLANCAFAFGQLNMLAQSRP